MLPLGGSARAGYLSTPNYLVESLSIKVTVHDLEGTTGHIETSIQLKLLKDNVSEMVWGKLNSTGIEQNLRAEGGENVTTKISQQAGEALLKLLFSKPLKRGDRIGFVFEFDVVNSVPESKTYWAHAVTWPTRNLAITLIVPRETPCKTAEAFSEDALVHGDKRRQEHPPAIFEDNSKLQWIIPDPEEGRNYVVVCYQ